MMHWVLKCYVCKRERKGERGRERGGERESEQAALQTAEGLPCIIPGAATSSLTRTVVGSALLCLSHGLKIVAEEKTRMNAAVTPSLKLMLWPLLSQLQVTGG